MLFVSKEFLFINEELLVIISFLTFLYFFFTKVSSFISDSFDESISDIRTSVASSMEEYNTLLNENLQRLEMVENTLINFTAMYQEFLFVTLNRLEGPNKDASVLSLVSNKYLAVSTLQQISEVELPALDVVPVDLSPMHMELPLVKKLPPVVPEGGLLLTAFPSGTLALLTLNILALHASL